MKTLGFLFVALVSASNVAAQSDTTFSVERGARLRVRNDRGLVYINTWSRDRVEFSADFERRGDVDIRSSASVVRIDSESRRGPSDIDMRITIPDWMAVSVDGPFADVELRDIGGEVSVEVTQGDVQVHGAGGSVLVQATNGDVSVSRARGGVDVISTNGDIDVTDVSGDLAVETINGEIVLRRVQSLRVRVYTLNGDVVYDGTVDSGGEYEFETHNGDIRLLLPTTLNATFSFSTSRGEFETDCPVRLTRSLDRGRQFEFSVGRGDAAVDIRSFGGTISLETIGGCWDPNQ